MFEDITLLTTFLYVVGLLLLVVEAIAPGFGLPGIGGIICVIISIVMVTNSIYEVVLMVIATVAIFLLIAIALIKFGIGKKVLGKFILDTEQKSNEGYTSMDDNKKYIGKSGTALSDLRSSGVVVIEGQRIDAVSQGEYIEKNSKVQVVEVEGRKIVVRETK